MTDKSRRLEIPAFVLDDDLLIRIVNAITEVNNELQRDKDRDVVDALLAELDRRATDTYTIEDGKVIRRGA